MRLFKEINDKKSRCLVCNHFCVIKENETGKCGVRKNINGKIFSLVPDIINASGIDPVEKKPLFHIMPGSLSYSIASPGCNFSCLFCQNAELAQTPSIFSKIYGTRVSPKFIVKNAVINECKSISYTYSEPSVFFELMRETSIEAKKNDLLNLMVSNGFMSGLILEQLKDFIDGANIDLKSFNPDFYEKVCGGRLRPVLENLKKIRKYGIFLEITTLIIQGYNDSKKEIDQIVSFIKNELGEDTPWHVSAFYPAFRMQNAAPTNKNFIINAIESASKQGLKYVYSGNIISKDNESTYCPKCRKKLIERQGFYVIKNRIKKGKCPDCGQYINGIFE